MGTKRFIIATLLAGAITIPTMAQNEIIETEDISSFGVWTSIGVEKKLTKKWSVAAEGEFRTADAFNEVSRYSVGISTDYKFCSWLKGEVGYSFLRDNNLAQFEEDPIAAEDEGWISSQGEYTDAYWTSRHRTNVSLIGSVKFGSFKLSLRERWQYTYRQETTKFESYYIIYDSSLPMEPLIDGLKEKTVKAKHSNVLRSRLQVEYDKKGLLIEPYASVEVYNDFDGFKIKKMRYTIGGDYKITKKHSVGLYYRYQDFFGNDDGESTHILGVGYKFKF